MNKIQLQTLEKHKCTDRSGTMECFSSNSLTDSKLFIGLVNRQQTRPFPPPVEVDICPFCEKKE